MSPAAPPERSLASRFYSDQEIERSRRYHRPLYLSFGVSTAISLGVLAALAFSPAGRWLAAPVDSLPRWAYALTYAALVVAAGAVVRSPVAFWRGYVHEHPWGFSTQGLGGWLFDWTKGLAVQVVLTAIVLLGLVELAAAAHGAWP